MTAVGVASANAAGRSDRRSRLTGGLIAGAVATATEAAWTRAQVTLLGGRQPVFTPDLMVQHMVLAATGRPLNRRVARALGVLMRSGYGPSWAAAWVLARGGRQPRLVRDLCVLGGIIWVVEITTLPIVRATPPLRRWPATDIALDLEQRAGFCRRGQCGSRHAQPVTAHDTGHSRYCRSARVSGDVDATASRQMEASSEGFRFAEGKWNLRIVAALLWKPMGFNQLSRALGGISQNTLANRLDSLEALGVIMRTVLSVTPPATLYTVDRPGRELRDVLTGLSRWGERWLASADGDGGALEFPRWNDG